MRCKEAGYLQFSVRDVIWSYGHVQSTNSNGIQVIDWESVRAMSFLMLILCL